jgi:hypothetical protein
MLARWTTVLLAAAALAAVTAVILAGVAACGGSATSSPPSSPAGSVSPSGSAQTPSGPAAGTKLAPGLYDLADGTVRAVGTVEHRDLEGGFWAVVGGTQAEGDLGQVVAVIVNGDDYAELFTQNEGFSFVIDGTRAGGASTRMAGPEIAATTVTLASDLGPAQ